MRLLLWLKPRLDRFRIRPGLALVAAVVAAPSLFCGFLYDDHNFLMIFQGCPGIPELNVSPLDTFRFYFEEDPALRLERMDRGLLPWWAGEDGRIAFMRPLSSLTHYADYLLFGESAWPMHLHSIFLYVMLVFALAALYRRIQGAHWIAWLAGLLYVLDDARSLPVAFLSSRNVLLTTFFSLLVLLLHDRWRRDGWKPGAPLALLALALGLSAGEAGLGVGGYLFAYAVFLDRGPFAKRFAALLPYGAVVLVWAYFYATLGYGTTGSQAYANPISEPLLYLSSLAQHLPIMLSTHYGLPDSSVWVFLPDTLGLLYLAGACVYAAILVWIFAPLLRHNRVARFWATGMGLSLLPVCAVTPQDRLLMLPGIGGMALLALLLGAAMDPPGWWPERGMWRKAVRLMTPMWVVIHLLLAPLFMWAGFASVPLMEAGALRANESVPADPAVAEDTVVIVNALAEMQGPGVPVVRSSLRQPVPKHTWMLSTGILGLEIERTGERTLVLRREDGFLQFPWGQLYRRTSRFPMRAGDVVELSGMRAEVLEATPDGRPASIKYTFAKPLEAPSLHWIIWDVEKSRFVPFQLPAVGETASLPPSPRLGILDIF